ncbi:MAG: 50S ribosomal protein L3 [Candidatus Kariarchaeaceae archaeon]|jgi:large subunit ribosomal protein L3
MTRRNVRAPHRSSLGYRRKRASSGKPQVRGWVNYSGDPKILGFPGFKAGMTRVIFREDRQRSHIANTNRLTAVTVIETPPIILMGLRTYKATPYGYKILADIWGASPNKFLKKRKRFPKEIDNAEQLSKLEESLESASEIRAIVHTQPDLTGTGAKKPEIMEIKIGANSLQEAFDWAKEKIGQELQIEDFTKPGEYLDVIGITKGKGFQGVIKRHGATKLQHKTKDGPRKVGSIGPWTPARLRWLIPRYGQMGYGRRTEYNKRVMQIGVDGEEITPDGGFVKYGNVKNRYIVVKGSIPGPKKRTIVMRDGTRNQSKNISEPNVSYISTISQQG